MDDKNGFKFTHAPQFDLESSAVREVDYQRVEMNLDVNAHLKQTGDDNPYPSIYTQDSIRRRVSLLRRSIARIDDSKMSTLDRLVLQDVTSNVLKVDTYLGRIEGRDITPAQYILGLFGNNSYTTILSSVRPRSSNNPYGYPDREIHDFTRARVAMGDKLLEVPELLSGGNSHDLSSLRSHVKKEMTLYADKSKLFIKKLFESLGIVEKFGDFDLTYEPSGSENKGFYNEDWNACFLSSDGLEIVRNPNNPGKPPYRMVGTSFLTVASHEGSHLVKNHLSRACFPQIAGLRTSYSSWVPMIHGVLEEGLSQNVEHDGIRLMRDSASELGLHREDVELEALFRSVDNWKKAPVILYNILKDEIERAERTGQPGRKTAGEELSHISGNPWHSINHRSFEDLSLDHLSRNLLMYFLGDIKISQLIGRLQNSGLTRQEAISGLHCGFWSDIGCQERFVREVWTPAISGEKKSGVNVPFNLRKKSLESRITG